MPVQPEPHRTRHCTAHRSPEGSRQRSIMYEVGAPCCQGTVQICQQNYETSDLLEQGLTPHSWMSSNAAWLWQIT